MKISFLGTGAAEGVPAMFCNCPLCQSVRAEGERGYHTRSQVIIDGEISVDFPPDAYAHSLKFGVDYSSLACVLVTHSHMDHFYAHDFILRGYKYAKVGVPKFTVYGNAEVKAVFEECTRREMKPEVLTGIDMTEVKAFQELKFKNYRILTLPAQHGTKEEALLYYIENNGKGYLHLYDTGALLKETVNFLAEKGAHANLIAFDCTFLDASPQKGTRHMCLQDDIFVFERLLAAGIADVNTKKVLTHFSHNSNPTVKRLAEIEQQYGVTAAYDGLALEI